MTDDRLDEFLRRLREEFPNYVVIVLPYQSPDDDTIENFLHLLDVPEDQLMPATWKAIDLAIEIYGRTNFPFCLTAIDPAVSREFFPKELEAARWGEARSASSKLVEARPLRLGLEPAAWKPGVRPALREWTAADSEVRVRVLDGPFTSRPPVRPQENGQGSRMHVFEDRQAAGRSLAS